MKKNFTKFLTVALSGAMLSTAFVAFAGCAPEEASAQSLVSIDVNPSVSLILDKNEKVLSVIAENEDAQVLIYETDFEGMKVEDAAKKLADLAVEYGYVSEENRGVTVTAQGDIDLAGVKESVSAAFSAAATDEGFTVNVSTDGLFSVNRELSMVNEEYNLNLSVGEYELIVRAQAADKSLTVEEAARLSTDELLEIVYDNADAFAPYVTAAYTEAKNAATTVYYKNKATALSGCYLLPYLNLLNVTKYNYQNAVFYQAYAMNAITLETGIYAAELAAKAANAVEISEETQNAIAGKLGITEETALAEYKAAIKGEDGKVTLLSLENYLNRYFKNMTADERAAAQAKFDEVMTLAKGKAQEIYADVDKALQESLGTTIGEMADELSEVIPASLQTAAQAYINEFKNTLNDVAASIEGKEPLAAAYAALETFNAKKEEKIAAIKAELSEDDLEKVETAIETLENTLAGFESTLNSAIERAETQAKDWLAQKQAERKQA